LETNFSGDGIGVSAGLTPIGRNVAVSELRAV
jgi:hypothetical protein